MTFTLAYEVIQQLRSEYSLRVNVFRFEKKDISCRLAPLTFESLSGTCLHRPKVGLLIPHTFHNLGVEAYFGEYVESLCNSVQVVQDLLLARICFAPVEILSDV